MREIRSSGSVEGAVGNHGSYSDVGATKRPALRSEWNRVRVALALWSGLSWAGLRR
jgi:hypothetical protein